MKNQKTPFKPPLHAPIAWDDFIAARTKQLEQQAQSSVLDFLNDLVPTPKSPANFNPPVSVANNQYGFHAHPQSPNEPQEIIFESDEDHSKSQNDFF